MNLRSIVIFVASVFGVLLVPVSGFSEPLDREPMQQRYNPAAESMSRVPGVVGMYENEARFSLQQTGLAVDVRRIKKEDVRYKGKEGMVITQVPSTGGVAMLGSSVLITVYFPPDMQLPSSDDMWDGGDSFEEWTPPTEEGFDQEHEVREEIVPMDPGIGTGWIPPSQRGLGDDYDADEENEGVSPPSQNRTGISLPNKGQRPMIKIKDRQLLLRQKDSQ